IKKLNNVLSKLSTLKNKIQSNEKIKITLPDLIDIFNDIKFYEYKISYSSKIKSPENIRYIYDKIFSKVIPFDANQRISNYIENLEEKDENIIIKLLDIYNKLIEGNDTNEIKNIERDIYDLLTKRELTELQEKLNELYSSTARVRENIELQKNESLIDIYKNFSAKQNIVIIILTFLIFALFLIIISFIIIAFIFFSDYSDLLNLKVYAYQLSLYVALSALLAFIIKERARYLNIKNYCDKSWLELSAMPAYMGEFSKEENIMLRTILAEKYFAGPYGDNSKVEVNNDLNPNMIIELTKALKDFKGK
ncbi:TPA: hypothetical protein JI367_RS20915, partial [Acinetobacter baumannii]|nr:hypothetical protein [Acinetobacter baumannii]